MYKLQKRVDWCRNITCVYCTCMYMTVSGTGKGGGRGGCPPPPNFSEGGFKIAGGRSLLADCVA